jgi:putative ABC transport system permease protein
MLRWAWRLFRREWRQQALILLLVAVAVGAVVVGAAVATNTPPPADTGFGTAGDLATFALNGKQGPDLESVDSQVALLEHRFGRVQVIENETRSVPGSTQTYQLRAQDPHGPFGGPMLQLVSGRYPTTPDEVALTAGLASDLGLGVGDVWSDGGRRIVGIVRNPQSLLDEFALVVPGQVTQPTSVDVLFDAPGVDPGRIGSNVTTPAMQHNANSINPDTIVLALTTVGMLLIALVSVGGFTVVAQRRLRALGMLESMGATDRNVRLVLRANGVIVGAVGAVVGLAVGVVAWLAYRPLNEQSAHHLIPMFALPWSVVAMAMALAMVATLFAAGHPARAITRMSVVSALAGRPAPPRQIRRSFTPGVVALVIGFVMFSLSGAQRAPIWLVPGFVALVAGIILVAPFFLAALARISRRAPIAIRLPLRDLSRYRARSGSALSAISVGVLIAVVICAVAIARYSNVYDYVGPNLTPNELAVWSPTGQNGDSPDPSAPTSLELGSLEAAVRSVGSAVGALHVVELDNPAPSVGLQNPSASGRQWDGQIFVATPALLSAYGIDPSSVPPDVDVLSSRPGLAGSGVQLTFGGGDAKGAPLLGPGSGGPTASGAPGSGNTNNCSPGACIAHPVILEESRLPSGTSAPNTLITESALHQMQLAGQSSLDGWMIEAHDSLTTTQITDAQSLAASAGLAVETKNDAPTSSEIVDWATVFAIGLAMGILAMSIGLLRSEMASELRTLTATGAGSRTRRAMTAFTAAGLAFLGALLGALAAYVGLAGWFRANAVEGGLSDIVDHVPWDNLFLIVVAMPLVAGLVGWLLAGRQPTGIATRPME